MPGGTFQLARELSVRSRITTYAAALAILLAAVGLRWQLDPVMGPTLPLVTLFGAVAAAVWMGGYRPALLVAVLGYLACAYLFIDPRGSFGVPEARNLVGLLAYLLTCAVIIGFGEALRVAQRRFEELARQHDQLSASTFVNVESIRRLHSLRDLTTIGFGLTLAVLVVGGALGYLNARRLAENERSVAHSHEVISVLGSLLSTITDAETGQRGYLLALDEKYLQPYDEALARVDATIARLRELATDDAAQQARLAGLEQRIALRLDELKRTVALMKGGDRPAALVIVRGHEGQALMDGVREAVADMQRVEAARLRRRSTESEESSRITVLSILIPAMLGVILVCSVFYLSRRNLAQRQRAGDILAEQRERLRVTLASIGDAVIITDPEGRITYLNAVAEYVTGWRHDEVAGHPLDAVFRIVNEETREAVENPARRALRDGVIVGLANHTALIRKDETDRPIEDSAAPIRTGQGRVLGCVLIFRDITERRRAELELWQSRELQRITLASIGDAVITTDTEGQITFLNAVAEGLTGWTLAEAAGQSLTTVFNIINEQTRQSVENPATRVLREGVIVGLANHTVLITKDGVERPIDDSAAPITDEQGRVVGCVLIFRDVAERRQTEKRIYGLMIDLQEADRRKDEFLALLAHELRGPLAPLSHTLEIMKRAEGDGELLRQTRGTMERQLGQLVRLVDDLLDVSRITRNKLELRAERLDLAVTLHQAVETCRPLAESLKHEVTVTVPPEPIHVHADSVRLTQVFSNLLHNACKFTEPGGRIWVTAERQGSDVLVSVKDTGIGIPPAMLLRIFDLFTQGDRTLERSHGGLGIGLTLAKHLVDMHGGTVEASSAGPGFGSEFVVRLPILVKHPEVAERAATPTVSRHAAGPRRILVVDDNADSAESLAMLLKLNGHETRLAYDGLQAVEAAEQFRPDLVLLDIGLPKLNGFDACRRIREHAWGQNMVLVALTGWGQEEDRRKTKDAGFDHHLTKPVDYDALMQLLVSRAAPVPR
jgi:PAS domain S-box-containing protein